MRCKSTCAIGQYFFFLFFFISVASAYDDSPVESINVAYANILGTGIYQVGDRNAYVLHIPLEFDLYEPEDADWSLNLLLPATVGVLDADWGDLIGGDLDGSNLQTLGLTPGIEVNIPLADHWILKPFIEGGYVFDMKEDYDAWFYMGGVSSLLSYQLGDYTIGLGAKVIVAEQRPVYRGEVTGVGVINLGVDVRRLLDMQLGNQRLELGAFAIVSRYFDDLDLLSIEDDRFHIENTYEIGLTLGTVQPYRFLGMDWERVGIGYMWGDDGLESITFNMGFPF